MPQPEENKPWDRIPEENSRWYGRFEEYRLMGPDRSVLEIYNRWRERNGKIRTNTQPKSWSVKCTEYKWRARAEAWDESEREEFRQLRDKEAKQFKELHIQALRAAYAKLGTRLQALDPDELDADKVSGQLIAIGKELRALYGIDVTQKVELSGPEGKPIAIDLELRRIISQRAEEIRDEIDARPEE
jgi:hypothetical protein